MVFYSGLFFGLCCSFSSGAAALVEFLYVETAVAFVCKLFFIQTSLF